MRVKLRSGSTGHVGLAAHSLAAAAVLFSPAVSHAKSKTVQLAVENVQETQNCGITEQLITDALTSFAKSNDLRLRRSKADFIIFADVNVLAIPNSLGVWSKSCSFNVNIEFQRHQEIEIKGVGDVLSSAKLCDAGYLGLIGDGNLQFFNEALQQSFEACLAKLPRKIRQALAS